MVPLGGAQYKFSIFNTSTSDGGKLMLKTAKILELILNPNPLNPPTKRVETIISYIIT